MVWKRAAAGICAVLFLAGSGADMVQASGKSSTEKNGKHETKEEAGSRVVTDHAGNKVELPDEIHRIAVTDTLPLPSVLSLFLGSGEEIVGMSPVSRTAAENSLLGTLYPELLQADTSFFENNELNVEALMQLKPDVVFYNAGSTVIEDALESAGLTGIAVSVTKWEYDAAETYNQWLLLLEEIFPEREGIAQKAADYCEEVAFLIQEREEDLTEEDKKKVFYLFNYSDSGIVTSGEKFWGQFWCDAAGAVNVSREVPAEKSSAVVNMEQIYKWNPDVIFISNFTGAQPEDLYENTAEGYDWSPVKAVSDRQVYKMPMGAYRTFTPGADTPLTMLWTAKQIYPDLFEDIDMKEEMKTCYREIYGVELTDEQVEHTGIEQ